MQKCLISNINLVSPPEWNSSFTPILSPIESAKQMLTYRNLFYLHKRNCDATGKSIISIYPQNANLKVYDKSFWFSDNWNPLDYGQNYDSNLSIFEQFNNLVRKVPQFSLQNVKTENADYCNSIESAKDCYLAFVAYGNCKDIYYSYRSIASSDIYFSANSSNSELLFYCFSSSNCYDNIYCEFCKNTQTSLFSFSLENCKNCIFCSNLVNKENYILNKPATSQQVKEFKEKLVLGSYKNLMQCITKYNNLKSQALFKAYNNLNCNNSSGNELLNCNNAFDSYVGNAGEDIFESFHFMSASKCYRSFGFSNSDNLYMASGCTNTTESDLLFLCFFCYQCQYCINIHNCKNCFFCSGIRNKEYCILNKQYTKEQYFKLKEIIINKMKERTIDHPILKKYDVKEWGQFFPPKYSFFPYNKSYANAVFKMQKEEALAKGFNWEDEEEEILGDKTLYQAPDNIKEWSDNLDNKVLKCSESGKFFNLIPQVIKKFKEYNLNFLRIHPLNYQIEKQMYLNLWMTDRQTINGKNIKSIFTENQASRICSPEEYYDII